MNDGTGFRLYSGDGTTISSRNLQLPSRERNQRIDHPQHYLADKPLRDAVNVALALGQPLLVTGEPGTGKTQLASSIAWELQLPPPLIFNTKTTSVARDLFYRYDALRHFHDVQLAKAQTSADGTHPSLGSYLSFEALGVAILRTLSDGGGSQLPESSKAERSTSSVVLIDEVDKAPRDFPNDILNEIERMEFTVQESGQTFRADSAFRPIVVLTSNSEKNLPDAFLRRCVFYHIPFPDRERLRNIVNRRLGSDEFFTPRMLEKALQHFERIRSLPLRKKPATAECLAWLEILVKLEIDIDKLKPGDIETLAFTYSALVKTGEDMSLVVDRIPAPSPENP